MTVDFVVHAHRSVLVDPVTNLDANDSQLKLILPTSKNSRIVERFLLRKQEPFLEPRASWTWNRKQVAVKNSRKINGRGDRI